MIIIENITIRNRDFIRTYSDKNMMIECDGIHYSEAIDPSNIHRYYIETDIPVESEHTKNTQALDE